MRAIGWRESAAILGVYLATGWAIVGLGAVAVNVWHWSAWVGLASLVLSPVPVIVWTDRRDKKRRRDLEAELRASVRALGRSDLERRA